MVGRAPANASSVTRSMIRMVLGLTETRTDRGTFWVWLQLRTADGPCSGHPAVRYSDFRMIVPSGSALRPLYDVLTASWLGWW